MELLRQVYLDLIGFSACILCCCSFLIQDFHFDFQILELSSEALDKVVLLLIGAMFLAS